MTIENPKVRIFCTKMKSEFFELSEDKRIAFMAKDRASLDQPGWTHFSVAALPANTPVTVFVKPRNHSN